MWQIVFGIVFRLESASIFCLWSRENNPIELSFFLVDIVISCSSPALFHRLIAFDLYHASGSTSLRNEVANVQRCVTFVTERPLCGDKMRWGQTTTHHISPGFFVLLFSHSRGRVFHFDCISFGGDMPAWVIAAYSWICNDGQRFFVILARFLSFRL